MIPTAGSFRSNPNTRIVIDSTDPAVAKIANQLAKRRSARNAATTAH